MPKVFIYAPNRNLTTGSVRLFSHDLSRRFYELGILTEDRSDADYVLIGRGSISQYFRDEGVTKPKNQRIGAMNPSAEILKVDRQWLECIDFFHAGSFEEKDFLARFRKPVFVLPPIEDLPLSPRVRRSSDEIFLVGYHGNKIHLESMPREVRDALKRLGKEQKVVLRAVYDRESLGPINLRIPSVEIEELQWNFSSLAETLSSVDVGIAHNSSFKARTFRPRRFRHAHSPHLSLDFKYTSNFGRAAVFFQLGVPYVADASPSNVYFQSRVGGGEIAITTDAWFEKLAFLARHPYEHPNEKRLLTLEQFRDALDGNVGEWLGEIMVNFPPSSAP